MVDYAGHGAHPSVAGLLLQPADWYSHDDGPSFRDGGLRYSAPPM